ncbi:MAG: Asp-tRNA(Asn)/Glu-tRNA(Gln) amidotransferase subunit GatC [Phycisphaerae bacterium]
MAERIDEQQVRHIAMLSRLKLSDQELSLFTRQLSAILDYVQKLNELDTRQVEPTAHAVPIHNVFRDDEPDEPLGVDVALANAPQREGSFYKVPKVLEQESA